MASRTGRILWVTIALVVVLGAALAYRTEQRSIQVVRTAKVERQDIHASVVTNGKSEPIVYREVRAEVEGEVTALPIREGDQVRQGQKLVELSQRQIQSELEQARAELADAEEAARLLRQGGTTVQLNELKAQLENARRERDQAAKLAAENARLVEKGAVARLDLEQSRARLAKTESDVAVLEQKLRQPYDPEEMKRAEARREAAQAALRLAEFHSRATTVAAPFDGVVYSIPIRNRDHVNRGDVLARVGELDRVRVRVFVDEPDLGRVAAAQPVLITWDGLPGRQWKGAVERLPTEVKELGSRTVGEVDCTVENPSGELLPNMNLNVEIVTESKTGILALPREAVIGDDSARFVYRVRNGVLARQAVKTGILSPTRAEILEGLQPGDEVALTGDVALQEGMRVRVNGE
ncbi:MAG: efflux RND transporter periplasmic adaptor subunit [Acidobacteria bacterium]|nr:efflux RND transporter periplasmic adaptor subunit [Acidobacteriota bacterium]